MRVLWVVKGLGPGGAERLLCAQARAHGDEFDIDCAYVLPWKDHLVGELESAGVRTICLSRKRSDRLWPKRLASLVRSGEYDVVHVHSPLPGSVARLATRTMSKSRRPGIVATEHNRWATHRLPTRLANRSTSRWNDATFAVTDEVRDSISGAAAEDAETLRHGIDIDRVAAATIHRAAIREEFGIGDDEFVVGTVANFRPQKDYPNLLRAAQELMNRDVPVRIIAVGQGPDEDEIRSLHWDLGLTDRVILPGFRDDAVRVMAACDAFTLASQWEGLPVAVMEALALGLPIVATDVGGMAEELTDGVDALLVPARDSEALANGIARIAEDTELRTSLAAASKRRAPEFGVDRTVEVIEAAYRSSARAGSAAAEGDAESAETPAKSPRPPALEIRPATPDDRPAIIELLGRSLGSDGDPRYPDLYAWKHDHNRFGPSPTWVAVDGDRIAAVRALMRWEFVRGDEVLRAVRAVDTATDPEYQGKGLFRSLTMHGIDQMREEGVDFVFNTPNDQSRPGYLKMGWREVGKLPAAVRFTGPRGAAQALRSRVPADRWSTEIDVGVPVIDWLDEGGVGDRWPTATDVRQIRTNMDDDYLRWRFGTDLLAYRVIDDGDAAVIVRARARGQARELAVVARFGNQQAAQRLAIDAARTADCAYTIRIGDPSTRLREVSIPGGGPVLTWRALNDDGFPPLSNWAVTLGDIELF